MQSFSLPNYSGLLYNKGNTKTPLLTAIAPRMQYTDSVEFVTGQEYETGGGAQPEISETASLTAPDPTFVTTSQKTNVTQIFQESFGISDAKLSNMGTMSGVNIAGQQPNPRNPLDLQTAAKMTKISRDIEYTFINGVYQKAAADNQANKSRGLVNAITTNTFSMEGKPLGLWKVAEMLKLMRDNNADTEGLVLWLDSTSLFQINADAAQNGLTIVPSDRVYNGIRLMSLLTPLGEIYLRLGEFLPAGKVLVLNLPVIKPREQLTPGKGNFYREALAKTGAGEKYQIFGQIGLDYGPEFYHGMFTNVSTEFKAPASAKAVYITNGAVGTVESPAEITGATLNKSTVAADNTAKVAVASTSYSPTPVTAATLSYLWQVRAKTGTVWTDLTKAYTGYNTAELTVKAADAEKHYRCKVTAAGSATGTVYSDECTVNAAG